MSCPIEAPSRVKYSRARHAAHYSNKPGVGHDLETWDVLQDRFNDPPPPEVPRDAERHSGYRDEEGRQHVCYVRTAPMTGDCRWCKYQREVQVAHALGGDSGAWDVILAQAEECQ